MGFWTYLLHCRGGSFYSGHTDDLDFRIAQHKSGVIAGYTRDHQPVELVWSQEFGTRQEAFEAERKIKGWSRAKKLAMIRGDWDAVSHYAKKKDSRRPNGPASLPTSSGRAEEGQGSEGEVVLSPALAQALRTRAAAAHPRECCGLLLGQGGQITAAQAAANTHPTPHTHFEIDAQALIAAHRAAREGGPHIIGYYHSHPRGPASPSPTDQGQAAGDGRVWAIIGADGEIGLWRDDICGFTRLSPGPNPR